MPQPFHEYRLALGKVAAVGVQFLDAWFTHEGKALAFALAVCFGPPGDVLDPLHAEVVAGLDYFFLLIHCCCSPSAQLRAVDR